MMTLTYALKQSGNDWVFDKESEFEDFLWNHLEQLLKITPFKRQYYVKGQFCDILGIGENKELIIIELKVSEDRYIVQQLTRYYDALLEEKPFATEIDYSQKVQLIAILPTIHKDSLIDAKYSILDIRFMYFVLQENDQKIYFKLNDYQTDFCYPLIAIPCQNQDHSDNLDLPDIPKKLKQMMFKGTELEQISIYNIRKQLLSFHKKVSEQVVSESIIYQFNKTSPVAEIRSDNKRNQIALFLWLPLSSSQTMSLNIRRTILRMRIWTDWQTVLYLGYIRKGTGVMITTEELKTFPAKMIPASLLPFKQSNDSLLQYHKNYTFNQAKYSTDFFEKNLELRAKYIQFIIDYFNQQRKNIYHQKHGEPLALTADEYIRIIINRKKHKNEFFLSQVMDLDNPDFSLEKFVELALTERFLSLNKSR